MADLLDIAPSTSQRSVEIDGKSIIVQGLHIDAIASILARYPRIVDALKVSADNSLALIQFGQSVGPIIAAGVGKLGDETYEQRAAQISAEDQVKLVDAIFELSFPNGLISFVTIAAEAATRFMGGTGEREKPIRMRSKTWASQSQPSSAVDSVTIRS
jgi:hypothetical protein